MSSGPGSDFPMLPVIDAHEEKWIGEACQEENYGDE
jgi:hypothetical protein